MKVTAYPLPKAWVGPKGRTRLRGRLSLHREKLDAHFMRLALEEAKRAGETGEVPVGCVVVRRGQVVYRCHNLVEREGNALRHAELIALEAMSRRYGRRLMEFTLYVNLEPCLMCAGAMVNARLGRVVFAAWDPQKGACGSGLNAFSLPGSLWHVKSTGGIRGREAKDLLQGFFQKRRRDR